MNNRRGFSIRTFLAEGTPDNLQLIEHSQWIGRGVVIPRAVFDQHSARPELSGTGIYLLDGASPRTGCERVYIGQTSSLRDNMERVQRKDFWMRMIVFSAEGPRLHRAHTDYIEARLLEIARETKAAELDNTKTPEATQLWESDRADADNFVDQVMLVAPTLGVRAFESIPAMGRGGELVRLTSNGANASGYGAGGRFVVQANSAASRQDGPGCPGHVLDLRDSLVERGVLVEEGKQLKFTQAFAFASAKQAAQLVTADDAEGASWRAGATSAATEEHRETPGRVENHVTPAINVKPLRAKPVEAGAE
ncbi:MAG: GIY-YIG nuclease family protein [Phycisphaerales bacterium]